MKKNRKKESQLFVKGMKEQLIKLGAYEKSDILDNVFEMETKGGLLRLRIDGEFMFNLFTCFYDVNKAKTLNLSDLNNFTGKWNHHLCNMTANQAIEAIVNKIKTII